MKPNSFGTNAFRGGIAREIEDLNGNAIGIFVCGVLFSRIATGIWLGPHASWAAAVVLVLVFVYFGLAAPQRLATRVVTTILIFYLVQVHFLVPGDFLFRAFQFGLRQLFTLWTAISLSLLILPRRDNSSVVSDVRRSPINLIQLVPRKRINLLP